MIESHVTARHKYKGKKETIFYHLQKNWAFLLPSMTLLLPSMTPIYDTIVTLLYCTKTSTVLQLHNGIR